MDPNKEPQNDEFEQRKDSAVSGFEEENAHNVSPSDSASDNSGNSDESANVEDYDEPYEDEIPPHEAVARQHAKYREEERKRIAAEAKLRELESKQPQPQAPVIPPIPDAFDDNFEEKMKIRDQKIRESFEFEQKQKQANRPAPQQDDSQASDDIRTLGENYTKRAKEFGVTQQDLQKGSQTIQQAGLNEELVRTILEDDKGPLITRYMAKNPTAAIRLSEMSTVQAILHLERVIRPKLNAKKVTKTTPPPTRRSGGAAAGERERFPLTAGKAQFK